MIPVDKLKAAGVNVAGAIHEDFLNSFARAHFAHNPTVYAGSAQVDQFDDLIQVDFRAQAPISFDLDPITPYRFEKIWKRHLLQKGGNPAVLRRRGITPENVAVNMDPVLFTVTVYEGKDTSKIRFTVDFRWALRARAAVLLKDEGGGHRSVHLEPIKVTFEKSLKLITRDISIALRGREPDLESGDEFLRYEDEWCVKVERLILLILNGLLSTQVANFIRAWELPRAIELIDGVVLQPDFLLVENDHLIVGAQVAGAPTGISPLQAELTSLISEFSRRYSEEFDALPQDQLERWTPEASPTVRWLETYTRDLISQTFDERKRARAPALAQPTVNLLTDSALPDILAKKFLSVNDGWSGSIELDRLVKGQVGWWFRVDSASGSIVPNGFSIHANVAVGGMAQVCHFNFDPKHFGKWSCYGPCVNFSPDPDFGLDAYPLFFRDGIYLNARLTTRGISVSYCDWPSWANAILGWATSMLTRPLLDAIRSIIARFYIRITKYPLHFPGTGLEWTPNMSIRPVNMGDYLVFEAAPTFK